MMPLTNLGTISTDLSHAETILQIADSLDQLELLTSNIFNGIKRHIDSNNQQLTNIDKRIKVASDKVDALKTKKHKTATCLYASAKYPAPDYQDYQTCLTPDLQAQFVRKSNYKSKGSSGDTSDRGLDQREIKEKLHFYHVKPKPKSSTSLFEPPAQKSPSPTLWSSASYLLFNTAENPYGNLSTYMDPFDSRAKKNKNFNNFEDRPDSGERQGLSEAPSSLSNLHGLDNTFNENLYIPDIGDLPDFELPEVLPDLPGIAQNLAFAHSSLDELPDIPFFEDNKSLPVLSPPMPVQEPQTRVVQQQEEQRTGPPLPPVEAPPTLPPFPPEPELPKASQPVQTTVPDRQPDEPDSVPTVGTPHAAVAVDEGRASLMEAIRLAGGSNQAGLKSVQEQKAEEKKSKETASKAKAVKGGGGGDLMSDLASKLAMRRKGISGVHRPDVGPAAGTAGSSGGGRQDAMSKISSLIPPPPIQLAKTQTSLSDGSDDDWS